MSKYQVPKEFKSMYDKFKEWRKGYRFDNDPEDAMALAYYAGYEEANKEHLANVWHDADELPKIEHGVYSFIVVERVSSYEGVYFSYARDVEAYFADHDNIVRWAYIEDLLPNKIERQ